MGVKSNISTTSPATATANNNIDSHNYDNDTPNKNALS